MAASRPINNQASHKGVNVVDMSVIPDAVVAVAQSGPALRGATLPPRQQRLAPRSPVQLPQGDGAPHIQLPPTTQQQQQPAGSASVTRRDDVKGGVRRHGQLGPWSGAPRGRHSTTSTKARGRRSDASFARRRSTRETLPPAVCMPRASSATCASAGSSHQLSSAMVQAPEPDQGHGSKQQQQQQHQRGRWGSNKLGSWRLKASKGRQADVRKQPASSSTQAQRVDVSQHGRLASAVQLYHHRIG